MFIGRRHVDIQTARFTRVINNREWTLIREEYAKHVVVRIFPSNKTSDDGHSFVFDKATKELI